MVALEARRKRDLVWDRSRVRETWFKVIWSCSWKMTTRARRRDESEEFRRERWVQSLPWISLHPLWTTSTTWFVPLSTAVTHSSVENKIQTLSTARCGPASSPPPKFGRESNTAVSGLVWRVRERDSLIRTPLGPCYNCYINSYQELWGDGLNKATWPCQHPVVRRDSPNCGCGGFSWEW